MSSHLIRRCRSRPRRRNDLMKIPPRVTRWRTTLNRKPYPENRRCTDGAAWKNVRNYYDAVIYAAFTEKAEADEHKTPAELSRQQISCVKSSTCQASREQRSGEGALSKRSRCSLPKGHLTGFILYGLTAFNRNQTTARWENSEITGL